MTSIGMPSSRSASRPRQPPRSPGWTRLCAEQLSGIADPLFPALSIARPAEGAAAARAVLAGLVEPLDSPLATERLPTWLLPHQADAVRRARAVLRRFGGVLIADGVGLGKTYVALALASLERATGGEVAAIVPAALVPEWTAAAAAVRMPLTILSHTRLARRAPWLPDGCTLLLVDEAHAFRNENTRRYDALARLSIGRRVALLTATPFNNAPADILSLLQLFAPRDRFREFGVADLERALCGDRAGTAALALGAVSVCRTRRLVEERFPELKALFPRRVLRPPLRYDLAACYGGRLDALLRALAELAGGAAAEGAGALLHLGLLRRLESSPAALRRSLLRHLAFLDEATRAAESGHALSRRDFGRACPRGEANDVQLVLWQMLGTTGRTDTRALAAAAAPLERALELVAASGPDPKCAALEGLLAARPVHARSIVFTEYRDTALHLLRALRRRFRVMAVAGGSGWAGATPIARSEALGAFAPGRRPGALLDAEILIATDVASEGLNLQDASLVVNYDLPWNPVRVMQRVGRIDRLGSPHATSEIVHLMPAAGLADVSSVLRILREKLAAMEHLPGSEPDPLAALWWVDEGSLPDAVEREAWRRVSAFEGRERWHMLAGSARARDAAPLVGAVLVDDDGPPSLGVLLALEWPGGSRVPLPYVLVAGRAPARDAAALAALAERALRGRDLGVEPAAFTSALAAVLPDARDHLIELAAARHGGRCVGAGRRAALELLGAAAARTHRARAPSQELDRALLALGRELPAGLDRLVADLVREGDETATARGIVEAVHKNAPPAEPRLEGTPRLILVAALAVVTDCPSH
jgi:superfamily II DNA or RNA helicase